MAQHRGDKFLLINITDKNTINHLSTQIYIFENVMMLSIIMKYRYSIQGIFAFSYAFLCI
jgi:hypothetical protein